MKIQPQCSSKMCKLKPQGDTWVVKGKMIDLQLLNQTTSHGGLTMSFRNLAALAMGIRSSEQVLPGSPCLHRLLGCFDDICIWRRSSASVNNGTIGGKASPWSPVRGEEWCLGGLVFCFLSQLPSRKPARGCGWHVIGAPSRKNLRESGLFYKTRVLRMIP